MATLDRHRIPLWRKLAYGAGFSGLALCLLELGSRFVLPDRTLYGRATIENGSVRIVPNENNPLYVDTHERRGLYCLGCNNVRPDGGRKFIFLGGSTMVGHVLNGFLPEPEARERREPLNPGLCDYHEGTRDGSPAKIAFHLISEALPGKMRAEAWNLACAGHGIRTASKLIEELVRNHGINRNLTLFWLDGHNEYLGPEVLRDTESTLRKASRVLNDRSRLVANCASYLAGVTGRDSRTPGSTVPLTETQKKLVEDSIGNDFAGLAALVKSCPDSHLYVFIPPANLEFPPVYHYSRQLSGNDLKRHVETIEAAKEAVRGGRIDEGVRLLALARDQYPENPWTHYMLGMALSKAGRLHEAKGSLQVALELDERPLRIKQSTRAMMRELAAYDSVTVVDLSDLKDYWGFHELLDGMHPNEETTFLFAREMARAYMRREFPDRLNDLPEISVDEYARRYFLSRDLADLCGAAACIKASVSHMTDPYFLRASEDGRNTLFGRLIGAARFLQQHKLGPAREALEALAKDYSANDINSFIASLYDMQVLVETAVSFAKGAPQDPYEIGFLHGSRDTGSIEFTLPFTPRGPVRCYVDGEDRAINMNGMNGLASGQKRFFVVSLDPPALCLAQTHVDPGGATKVEIRKGDSYILPEGMIFQHGKFLDRMEGIESRFYVTREGTPLLVSQLWRAQEPLSYNQGERVVRLKGGRFPTSAEFEGWTHGNRNTEGKGGTGSPFEVLLRTVRGVYEVDPFSFAEETRNWVREEIAGVLPHQEFLYEPRRTGGINPCMVLHNVYGGLARIDLTGDEKRKNVRFRVVRELKRL
jgi:tetratricopeptide (TPR) repeat protein